MWSCAKYRKHLHAYIDDELSVRTRQKIDRHLAGCPACRRELNGLLELAPLLQRDEVPPVPVGLSTWIMTEAALRKRQKEDGKSSRWRCHESLFRLCMVRGVTVAALAVGLVLGALMNWTSSQRADLEHRVAPTENVARNMYAFDVLGAEPRGSIEAATLALLGDER